MKRFAVELEVLYVFDVEAENREMAAFRAQRMLADNEPWIACQVVGEYAEELEPGQHITEPSVKRERPGFGSLPLLP